MIETSTLELEILFFISHLPTSQCQIGTLAFYLLNSYWFFLMLRGCAKALRSSKID